MLVATVLASVNVAAADARLGGGIGDFKAAWGHYSKSRALIRSARVSWQAREGKATLPPGVQEAEVIFIDKKACRIVLRVEAKANSTRVARYISEVSRKDCRGKLPKAVSNVNGVRLFRLEDETTVTDKQSKGRTVIVLTGPYYWQNEDVFNAEEARIRPPTSNH